MLILYSFAETAFFETHHYKDVRSLQFKESFNGWEGIVPVAILNTVINSFGVGVMLPFLYLANKRNGHVAF